MGPLQDRPVVFTALGGAVLYLLDDRTIWSIITPSSTPHDPQTSGRALYKRAQPADPNARTVSAVVAVHCAGRGGRQTT